ncbi:hypothetical protein [Azospirillum canadense]|uniref:hypothetical protein n=1 Tax=Azospirillum canadense TaxID=403962 RepID=UPI0022264ADE|nr:hypothetical protein [Azospirillum canadense]MCW2240668.1 hypothetical protein [Azospirillum canadense]
MTAAILRLHTAPATSGHTPNAAESADVAAQATRIVLDLILFAERHALPTPSDEALLIDGEVIARWPADLWCKAYRRLWETWAYRRMPTAGDFCAVIDTDLAGPHVSPAPASGTALPSSSAHASIASPGRPAPLRPPKTVDDCIATLRAAGIGTITTWKNRARSRDPNLTREDLADMTRWVPTIADLLTTIGLHGSP